MKPIFSALIVCLIISGCTNKTEFVRGEIDLQYISKDKESIINGKHVDEGVWVNDYTWRRMNAEMNECYYGKGK